MKVLGAGGVPTAGVSAIVMNLAATATHAVGYLSTWADGRPRTATGNVDFMANSGAQNFATVAVGTTGSIDLINGSAGAVQVIGDVAGYFLSTEISHVNMKWGAPTVPVAPSAGLVSSCASATFCEAVTPTGHVFSYDGTSWVTQADLIVKSRILAISCPTTTFCAAVDTMGWAYTYSSAGWSGPVWIPGHQAMTSVSCTSPTFCMAISQETNTAAIYDGTKWAPSLPVGGDTPLLLFDVSCSSPQLCFATNGDTTYRYTGSTTGWSDSSGPAFKTYGALSISCSVTGLCAAADSFGNVSVLKGGAWSAPVSLEPTSAAQTTRFLRVSCGASQCVAVGDDGRSFAYNGTSWVARGGLDIASAPFISCADGSFCIVTTGSGNASTFDGATWSAPVMVAPSTNLTALSCAPSAACAVVGLGGQVRTYDGSSWSDATQVDPYGSLQSISCPASGFCAAVDGVGYVVELSDGAWSSPVKVDLPSTGAKAISCASATFCVVVDGLGKAAVMNGSSWSPATTIAAGRQLASVSCPAADFCMAATGDGYASMFDGRQWTTLPIPESGVWDVSCPVAGFCAAASQTQVLLTYSAGYWHDSPVSSSGDGPVSCASVLFCLAGAGDGQVSVFNGAVWGPRVPTRSSTYLISISCAAGGFCAALDQANGLMIGRT